MTSMAVRSSLVALVLTTGCIAMSVPTATTSSGLVGEQEKDINRLGLDYRSFDLPAADPALCQAECEKDPKCKSFTYVKPGWQGPSARCWLKDPVPDPSKHECCVSGVKTVPADP